MTGGKRKRCGVLVRIPNRPEREGEGKSGGWDVGKDRIQHIQHTKNGGYFDLGISVWY